ncbi:MAG: hypothetical protein ABJM06_13270 [Gilvibacter sp.]
MKLNTFFTLNAIMFMPFGLAMLFIPTKVFSMIGLTFDAHGLEMASMVGSMLFSFGLVCLFARKYQGNSAALEAILIGNLSFHLIDSILTFKGAYSGVMNSTAYLFSSMHMLLALGFLFYLYKVKSEQKQEAKAAN